MRYIRDVIAQLKPYSVSQTQSCIRLNQNESPYDLPERLKRLVLDELAQIAWNRYPSLMSAELLRAIGLYTSFPVDGILASNGSDELIQAIMQCTCVPSDKVVLISPDFSMYSHLARIMGLKISEVPLDHEFKFNIPEIIREAADAKTLLLASPNNPTGSYLTDNELRTIAENCSQTLIVIDEAYFEFHRQTAQPLLDRFDNIVILRTFSKAVGLAGIRLGYALGRPEIIDNLRKVRLPYSVGIFQQIAGRVVMENSGYIDDIAERIRLERARIFNEFGKISTISPIQSSANFILFKVKEGLSKVIYDKLCANGILIRHFSSKKLENILRVTIGKPEENELLIANLREIIVQELGDDA